MTSICPKPLGQVIRAEFSGDYRADLATITGPRSDREVAELVERLVLHEMGLRAVGALFATKGVGAVFGLELVSGERVVLKLFPPSARITELAAQQRCLEMVVRSGFPATAPRSRLFRTEDEVVAAGADYLVAQVARLEFAHRLFDHCHALLLQGARLGQGRGLSLQVLEAVGVDRFDLGVRTQPKLGFDRLSLTQEANLPCIHPGHQPQSGDTWGAFAPAVVGSGRPSGVARVGPHRTEFWLLGRVRHPT